MRKRLFRTIGLAGLVGVAALTGCNLAYTDPVGIVYDTSATLKGRIQATEAGPLTYWFEYGLTPELGQATPDATATVAIDRPLAVTAVATGLAEDATYHYRTCIELPDGADQCSTLQQFTTTTGFDSLAGLGVVTEIVQIGYHVGGSFQIRADAHGNAPTGTVSLSPGSAYFRIVDTGPITCFRVSGNRAVVGFLADATSFDPAIPLVPRVAYVEDNGATGDRILSTSPAEPVLDCPDPATMAPTGGTIFRGDFQVHDHP